LTTTPGSGVTPFVSWARAMEFANPAKSTPKIGSNEQAVVFFIVHALSNTYARRVAKVPSSLAQAYYSKQNP
jgi:hypothetical protein